ncbi:MAG: transcription termination/antitermination NusG family protein, partial [Egicoccus sp.]
MSDATPPTTSEDAPDDGAVREELPATEAPDGPADAELREASDSEVPDAVPAAPETLVAADDVDGVAEPLTPTGELDSVAEAVVEVDPADDAAVDDAPDSRGSDDLDDLLGIVSGAGREDDAGVDESEEGAAGGEASDAVDAPVEDASDAAPADAAEPAEEAPVRRGRPRSLEDVRDKKELGRLLGDWYVVHTYAGYEQRVKDNLLSRVEALEAEDRIYEVHIPTEEVTEYKKGKKTTSQKKFLPGYVLVRMEMDDE